MRKAGTIIRIPYNGYGFIWYKWTRKNINAGIGNWGIRKGCTFDKNDQLMLLEITNAGLLPLFRMPALTEIVFQP